CKCSFDALRMICSTMDIAADWDPQHCRAAEVTPGAIMHHRQFIANLHHRGPDIVTKLDSGGRVQAPPSHANGNACDSTYGKLGIKDSLHTVFFSESGSDGKDTAFPMRNILSEDIQVGIKGQLLIECVVYRINHVYVIPARSSFADGVSHSQIGIG